MTTKTHDTKEFDTTEQPRARRGGLVSGKRGARTGAAQAAAGKARPILGDSPAVRRGVVEHAFGKRHWAAPWALALCEADPQFLTHLAEQPRGYAHFLCLIRMALPAQGADDSARAQARMLRAHSKKALLKTWFSSCPAGIINLLPKLPNKPLREHEYRWLIDALADSKIRKHLMHTKRIKRFDILLANDALNFPAQFRAAAMRCVQGEDDYETFLRTMHAANRLGMNITGREIVQAAEQAGAQKLDDWLMDKVAGRPFPPPPWEGDDKVRPIRSLAELKDAGEKFDNCLAGGRNQRQYASRVVAGLVYFYVCDHMPALIEVECEIFWGWRIDEMNGVKNRDLTSRQQNELTQRFMKAGISPEIMRRHRRRRF